MPMDEIMHKFKAGSLRSGSGSRVTSRRQAIAIGMHTEGEGKKKKKSVRDHMMDMNVSRRMGGGMGH